MIRRAAAPCVAAAVLLSFGGGGCAAALRAAAKVTFDSGRTFEHVRQLVSIGPRTPGSPGSAQARKYIRRQLELAGLKPTEQPFTAATPLGRRSMTNVSVVIPGARTERIVFGGHYDTKVFTDFRFVGANDGGSSTAMLLELARIFKGRRNPFTVEVVFFDGEEALVDWGLDDHTYGSRAYVDAARRSGDLARVRAVIVVDMIGDRNLDIRRELQSTKWLTDVIWRSAARLGYSRHFVEDSQVVEDDHVPFLQAGIPAVDLIDMQYDVWHTADDTLEHVSARSLQVVGDVLLESLPQIERALQQGPDPKPTGAKPSGSQGR